MRAAWAIARKEFRAAFASPVAYAWLAVFLGFTSWFFFRSFFVGNWCIGNQQGIGIRSKFMYRNTHIINHINNTFDLFRFNNIIR